MMSYHFNQAKDLPAVHTLFDSPVLFYNICGKVEKLKNHVNNVSSQEVWEPYCNVYSWKQASGL